MLSKIIATAIILAFVVAVVGVVWKTLFDPRHRAFMKLYKEHQMLQEKLKLLEPGSDEAAHIVRRMFENLDEQGKLLRG